MCADELLFGVEIFELGVVLLVVLCLDLAEATLALTPLAMLFIKSIFVNAKIIFKKTYIKKTVFCNYLKMESRYEKKFKSKCPK